MHVWFLGFADALFERLQTDMEENEKKKSTLCDEPKLACASQNATRASRRKQKAGKPQRRGNRAQKQQQQQQEKQQETPEQGEKRGGAVRAAAIRARAIKARRRLVTDATAAAWPCLPDDLATGKDTPTNKSQTSAATQGQASTSSWQLRPEAAVSTGVEETELATNELPARRGVRRHLASVPQSPRQETEQPRAFEHGVLASPSASSTGTSGLKRSPLSAFLERSAMLDISPPGCPSPFAAVVRPATRSEHGRSNQAGAQLRTPGFIATAVADAPDAQHCQEEPVSTSNNHQHRDQPQYQHAMPRAFGSPIPKPRALEHQASCSPFSQSFAVSSSIDAPFSNNVQLELFVSFVGCAVALTGNNFVVHTYTPARALHLTRQVLVVLMWRV